ncbi:MAG: hypothetical protein ACFFD3_17490 [Candidatus Thorarchaeota archaeon]
MFPIETIIRSDRIGSVRGKLTFNTENPLVFLESGVRLDDYSLDSTYDMRNELLIDGHQSKYKRDLLEFVKIRIYPFVKVIRPYSIDGVEKKGDVYPPSSNGWYGRMARAVNKGIYFIQEVVDRDYYWMTIVNPIDGSIMESHSIKPYELEILRMEDSWMKFNEIQECRGRDFGEKFKSKLMKLLDETELSWDEISKLAHGTPIPIIQRGSTVRETLTKLVPISAYTEDSRDEILAFLAWVAKGENLDEDVVEFVERIGFLPHFRSLLINHLKILYDNKPTPQYLDLIKSAASESPNWSSFSVDETQSMRPHAILRYRIFELAPNWYKDAIEMAKGFNESREIILSLSHSSISNDSQRQRLLISTMGFSPRAYVRPHSVGLQNLVYIGAAHRWAHRHLAYSLSFRTKSGKSIHLQSIVVPPLGAKRIESALPKIQNIEWSGSSINLDLYREAKGIWTMRIKHILNSISRNESLRNLKKKYGDWFGNVPHTLSREEAKIVDMINSTVFYLTHLKDKKIQKYWNVTEETAKRVLIHLRDQNIVDISYRFNMSADLILAGIIVEGQPESVYSITSALMRNCPTTRSMVSGSGKMSIINCRIPKEMQSVLFEDFPRLASDNGIVVKPLTITGHRNYEGSLYQRIIREDGTYDDDVSHFLSQIRSLPKSQDGLE